MVARCVVVRVMGLSSDGNAIIDIDNITRCIQVTPLISSSRIKPYRSIKCRHIMCPYPQRTCKQCEEVFKRQMNIGIL